MTIINTVKAVDGLEAKTQMSIIKTYWAEIAVFGSRLVGAKFLRLMEIMLTRPEFGPDENDPGVRSIIFRHDMHPLENDITNPDGPVLASCCAAAGAIIINVNKTLQFALNDAAESPEISVITSYHWNMMMNFMHELIHMEFLQKFPDYIIAKDEEEQTDRMAKKAILDIAKDFDIEPDHYSSIPYLSNLMDDIDQYGHVANKEWAEKQTHMIKHGLYLDRDATETRHGLQLWSFKQYCHAISGDDPNDPAWGGAVNKAQMETNTKEGNPPPAETVADNYIEPKHVETIHTGDSSRQVQPVEIVDDLFGAIPTAVGALDAAEALDMVEPGGYSPEYDMPIENEYTPQPVTSTPAQPATSIPVTPQPANTLPDASTNFPIAGGQSHPQSLTDPTVTLSESDRLVIRGLYIKMYNHIFQNCGRMLNSDDGFANPEAICTMPITLSEDEQRLVVMADVTNANGAKEFNQPIAGGLLRGQLLINGKLPAYKIAIKVGNQLEKRLIMPQNPGKKFNGAYTKTAMEARAGACIMYVMNSNETTRNSKNQFLLKIKDGQIEA